MSNLRHPIPPRMFANGKGLIGLIACGLLSMLAACYEPIDAADDALPSDTPSNQMFTKGQFSVTDGDTVRIRGFSKGTRLVGFNAPETFRPRCEAGRQLGSIATSRLRNLVDASNDVSLQLVPCACPPGTAGTDQCNFGRSCGVLRVDGVDVGTTLISQGLAAPFTCGATSCPPTPRPWCG